MLHSKEYNEYVLEDLKKYSGLTHPVRASLPERLLVRKVRTEKLHPNPNDEFCMPEIGPNYSIVQDYFAKFREIYPPSQQIVQTYRIKPLTVGKIRPNGYMLLNGHHRWLAACKLKMKTLPIKIVNVTQESDILKWLNHTKNRICVSFDLDEVIMAAENARNTEPRPKNPVALIYRQRIREGVPALIDALRRLGCDIWVYTNQYISEDQIRRLLRLYHVRVDGIVNGVKNRKSMGGIKERFREKYDVSVHVDVAGVTCVDTADKTYETVDLVKGETAWASEAMTSIRGMDAVKRALEREKICKE